MSRAESTFYVPGAEPSGPVGLRLRASDMRLQDGAHAALRALGFRRVQGEPPDNPGPVSVRLSRREPSPSRPGGTSTVIASDERGCLTRSDQGWEWTRPGYDLVVQSSADRAAAHFHEPTEGSLERRRVAYALRHALTALFPRRDRYSIHAAGVFPREAPGGGLIAGPSGSGKSTLTAGLVDQGWGCLSDDHLALVPPETEAETAWVYGMTRGIRLRPDAWSRFNEADLEEPSTGTERPLYGGAGKRTYGPGWKADPAESAVPRWILFSEITDRSESRLVRIGAAEALGQLLNQMHPPAALPESAAAAQLDAAAALIRQSECYHLSAGRDLHDDPGRLARLLPTGAGAPPSVEVNVPSGSGHK